MFRPPMATVWSALVVMVTNVVTSLNLVTTPSTTAATVTSSGRNQGLVQCPCYSNGSGLMDSGHYVALDTANQLPSGHYTAARIRLCATNEVWIQIWTQLSVNQFQFKWQTKYTPSPSHSLPSTTMINFISTPVDITGSDCLGLYSPSTLGESISMPYDSSGNYSVYLSGMSVASQTGFNVGDIIQTSSLRWTRSFTRNIAFCPNETACPAVSNDQINQFGGEQTGTAGVTDPSGLVGQCCANQSSSQQVQDLSEEVTLLSNQIIDLQNIINQLNILLRNQISAQLSTGTCPPGFISGSYGIGSCYVIQKTAVQMAQALLNCIDNYQASLVRITSPLEEQFLSSLLTANNTGGILEQYWTMGMFNFQTRSWLWFDEITDASQSFTYTNWYQGFEPTPTSDDDICMVLDITHNGVTTDYWTKQICYMQAYYICEVQKQCN